ncbi:unnamed protein product, partial [Rotaria sp. Silwood1]
LTLGLTGTLPLILVAHGATWKDRGTFNFAFYPFSFKLIWAPLIDALYSKRFGRRKSCQGVPREYLALVNIPVTLITIAAPLIIRHTELPLIWYAGSYLLYLISGIPIAAYVYFTPRIISTSYYYPLLILLLAWNEFIMTLRFAAQVGFFASISEPRIGGTLVLSSSSHDGSCHKY